MKSFICIHSSALSPSSPPSPSKTFLSAASGRQVDSQAPDCFLWSGSIQQNETELSSPPYFLSHTHTHTHFNHNGVPYVGVVQYTDSSSSRRWDSWSRKEFGDSERLATLTPPWLRDASSPDKAPVSSLWQQQRRQTNSRQESEPLSAVTSFYFSYQLPVFVFFFSPKGHCTWVCMAQQVEGGCGGPGGQSSWWVCLRVWPSRCQDFWLAEERIRYGQLLNTYFFFFFTGFWHLLEIIPCICHHLLVVVGSRVGIEALSGQVRCQSIFHRLQTILVLLILMDNAVTEWKELFVGCCRLLGGHRSSRLVKWDIKQKLSSQCSS